MTGTITEKQLQVLLGYAEEDLYDSSRQATAFGLLKVSSPTSIIDQLKGSTFNVCLI